MRRLLIVVDYQKDFVDGALGFPGAERLDPLIAERVRAYHAAGDDVAFTADTHGSDYLETLEGQKLPTPHCIEGTGGWALYGETCRTRDAERDTLISKNSFPSLHLANWLSGRGYDQVELCGLVSHICVLSNAVMVRAALPEAEILVDARLTASYDPTLHEKALDVLEGLQVSVTHRG